MFIFRMHKCIRMVFNVILPLTIVKCWRSNLSDRLKIGTHTPHTSVSFQPAFKHRTKFALLLSIGCDLYIGLAIFHMLIRGIDFHSKYCAFLSVATSTIELHRTPTTFSTIHPYGFCHMLDFFSICKQNYVCLSTLACRRHYTFSVHHFQVPSVEWNLQEKQWSLKAYMHFYKDICFHWY